jgi:hypothetical protein
MDSIMNLDQEWLWRAAFSALAPRSIGKTPALKAQAQLQWRGRNGRILTRPAMSVGTRGHWPPSQRD